MDYHIDLQMQRYEKYPTWQNKTATFCKKKESAPKLMGHPLFFAIRTLYLIFSARRLPLRAEVTFYSVKDYVNFRQRSYIVAYLSPTFLSAPSGLGVASFFILSFFDMFPSFFPL
jgi:hypothetical protein